MIHAQYFDKAFEITQFLFWTVLFIRKSNNNNNDTNKRFHPKMLLIKCNYKQRTWTDTEVHHVWIKSTSN